MPEPLDKRQTWSEAAIERLRELAEEKESGASCAEIINREFGTSFTRNSVNQPRQPVGHPDRQAAVRQRPSRQTPPPRHRDCRAVIGLRHGTDPSNVSALAKRAGLALRGRPRRKVPLKQPLPRQPQSGR